MIKMTERHLIKETLISIVGADNLLIDEQIRHHMYTKLGGSADFFVMPESVEQIQAIVRFANQADVPLILLGNGSNLIIRDGGIRGIVMNLKNLKTIRHQGEM